MFPPHRGDARRLSTRRGARLGQPGEHSTLEPGLRGPQSGTQVAPGAVTTVVPTQELEHLMTDHITLTGLVATVPEFKRIRDDVELTSFRLASSQRYFDRAAGNWVAGETNWYTVSAFRHLAGNVRESVHKGDRVVVMGRLRIRRWESGERNGTAIEVDAESIGHDLAWGIARYARTPAKDTGTARDSDSEPDASTGQTGYPDAPDQQEAHSDSARVQEDWAASAPGSAGLAAVTDGDAEAHRDRVAAQADTPF